MSQENSNLADEEPISIEPQPAADEPISLESATQEEEPIGLVEADEVRIKPQTLRSFGAGVGSALGEKKAEFKRPLNSTGHGAIRCRLFHSKIAVGSLDHMETQINEWLDETDVEIKHVGHVIGTMEGKRSEPNLLVMVWY